MKKYIQIIIASLITACALSCGDMDEMNRNKDASMHVPAGFLAQGLVLNMTSFNGSKGLFEETWIVKSASFTEHIEDYLYNDFGSSNYVGFYNLTNAEKMLATSNADATSSDETKSSYKGLYHFTRAFTFFDATMRMGDIPCSDAGKGTEGILAPKYESQEVVFGTIIRELDAASAAFKNGETFQGDAIYNGDNTKWEKLANSFMLRVLINLSKKTTVDGFDVKQKFAEYAQKALIETEADNFQRVYSDKKDHRYPFNYLQQNYKKEGVMGKLLVDKMIALKDRRIFYYAEPADKLLETHAENTFEAYSGVDVNMVYSEVAAERAAGIRSGFNLRYIYDPVCEPTAIMSSSEVYLIRAEAAARGWISSSAKEFYNKGVSEALKFTAKYTKVEYRHGVDVDDTYINWYLANEAKFNDMGSTDQKIEQIIWQKFIASFVQLKLNPYFDYRRTMVPNIPINAATNLNRDPNKMPMRWMYPLDESKFNSDNVKSAIDSQFGGTDYTTGIMWILK